MDTVAVPHKTDKSYSSPRNLGETPKQKHLHLLINTGTTKL